MNTPDDPKRFADAAPRSPLGELFAAAERDLPSNEQLARLAAQLGPMLDGPPSVPQAPASVPAVSGLLKLGVVAGVAAALVGGGLALRHSSHTATEAPTRTPKATVPSAGAASTPPIVPVAPLPVIEPTSSAGSTSPSPATEPTAAASTKALATPNKALSEAALLEQARRALSTSPSYALQLANQHRARFPNGVLTQEREVIAIEALRKLHRGSEADQRATGFSKTFPGSAHQRVVDETSPK